MTYSNGSSSHLCKDLIRYLFSTVQTCACLHLSVVWFVLGRILNMCNNEKRILVRRLLMHLFRKSLLAFARAAGKRL